MFIARDGQLFQSEYELDSSGKEIFRDTRALEWIIGAGENGLSGLVRQSDYVFQHRCLFTPRHSAGSCRRDTN